MDKNIQKIEEVKGRPMLYWYGKKPLQTIEWFPAQEKEVYGETTAKDFNKLFWGDNLQVLSHLLKKYRGKIDLIYIDPPFDSKAEYVKKVKIKGEQFEGQQQGLLEEKQYTDIWANDEYLQFMYERLLILRELLSDKGCIYLHCDYRKSSQLRLVMDEIYGEENFRAEIIWKQTRAKSTGSKNYGVEHNTILYYAKSNNYYWNLQYKDYDDDKLDRYYCYFEQEDGTYTKYTKSQMREFRQKDAYPKGKRFSLIPLLNLNKNRPNLTFEYKGFTETWATSKEELLKLEEAGLIIQTKPSAMPLKKQFFDEVEGVKIGTIWDDIYPVNSQALQKTDYPTQKPEELLERIINSSCDKGSTVMDCFCGSGTTLAVAQKLGRKWIGCDINLGAIQTTTKRLNQIIQEQSKEDNFSGLKGFKVLNVNEYDLFKNEMEAKEIIMDMYGIEPIKRSYFDGELDNKFVKVMPLNRVLNKLDITEVIKNIEKNIDTFTAKKTSKAGEETYEEGVLVIGSGIESDVMDYIKKENKTHVKIEVRDIQSDKKNLIFKKPPEAQIEVAVDKNILKVELKDFFSPLLVQKLQLENEKRLKEESITKIEAFKQIIESVTIDVNYDGKLFNAEIMDLPDKKSEIKAVYEYKYTTTGTNTVAIKIIDVLGEEYFETFKVEVKGK